ncbi:hypothetical protein [Labilibaculum euxinus]|uniref:Uncharacterized protein n=1 Tax=Labilibaculum euxinus TaxID=2686357 RepID=A0A7M4DBT2_9BACT|nr:hypothetical protein [Labilibaculum euxinus]MUP40111.1 hypothetical protein [Labilibaculum euxinus]MVB09316.1 hypothetical protein [Labilibaculum euxinus]
MKIIEIVILIAIYITGCKTIDPTMNNVTLEINRTNNSYFLQMKFVNNTKQHVYIPKLADLLMSDSLTISDRHGKNLTEFFFREELIDHIKRFGPKMGQINDFCKSYETLEENSNLELPPFSERKERIKRMIDLEFKHLISSNSLLKLTMNDILIIKDMTFTKYSHCIFLEPGETFEDCITINTLLEHNLGDEIILNYTPKDNIERYYYQLEYTNDSLEVNTELFQRFEGYKLFNKRLISNKLIIEKE